MLVDSLGRKHTYLRISLTEKCNLRCTYCMPENGLDLRPSRAFMTADEVIQLADQFISLGINKVRLTGGEPLVHKEFRKILRELSTRNVEISITSNAVLLDKFLDDLKSAGVKKLNISLDTLNAERFKSLTRRDDFLKVKSNIHLAIQNGFEVKINVVVLKDQNEDEIIDFVTWSKYERVDVRFIEFMPFDGNQWDWSKVVAQKDMLAKLQSHFGPEQIEKLPLEDHFIARTYRLIGGEGKFGFISTMTNSFCGTCNRIRLTADGKIKNCLFSSEELDLLSNLRAGNEVKELIMDSIAQKHSQNGGIDFSKPDQMPDHRSMIAIGG